MLLNYASLLTGWLSRLERPHWFIQSVIGAYARLYRVNLEEARHPLTHYRSLSQFFLRELKPGLRPLPEDRAGALLSPIDGLLRSSGTIVKGQILQVKGISYPIEKLLGDPGFASALEGGGYLNFYLSPSVYHRVHSPVSGSIPFSRHIPGALWPVNDWSLNRRPGLFAENERLIIRIETAAGPVAVVMVGALNVGSMSLAFDEWQTNLPARRSPSEHFYATPVTVQAGDELGRFHMGSAVVVLFGPGTFALLPPAMAQLPAELHYGALLARRSL